MKKNSRFLNGCFSIALYILIAGIRPAPAQTQNQIFAQLAGQSAIMDAAITVTYLSTQPEKTVYLDTNHDHKIDTIYTIDTDKRHGNSRQPLLVKIVDEDNDMYLTNTGDVDSDLYIADWYGDGVIDRMVDYYDMDGDGDVDEQYLYGKSGNDYYVVWAKDYGDDNRLWYEVNYEYDQVNTQWLTDFNGDEMFVYSFKYDYVNKSLTPTMENAFSFYDMDGDTYSEQVVRFSGTGRTAQNVRFSMDIDNDNQNNEPFHHDYDFSLSCLGPVEIPLDHCRVLDIRSLATEPVTRWEEMRQVACEAHWNKIHLTWDENDNNIDPTPGQEHYERWEGVISHVNNYMPQIGAPSCGPYNKRNEMDTDGSGEMQLYFSPVDHRLHLYGAEIGFIKVDYDYDGVVDMNIVTQDRDKNGFFDILQYDTDGDDRFDLIYQMQDDSMSIIPFEYSALNDQFVPSIEQNIEGNTALTQALYRKIRVLKNDDFRDPVDLYFDHEILNYDPEYGLGQKIKASREGQRYYLDLLRIRLWALYRQHAILLGLPFKTAEEQIIKGNFKKAAQLLDSISMPDIAKTARQWNNYPNPFSTSTNIMYFLSRDTHILIKVYTILGREVETCVDTRQTAGLYSIIWKAEKYPCGFYICSIETEERSDRIKMLLIR
jgi:hypothetical protein